MDNIIVTEKEKDPGDAKILVLGVGGGGNNALNRMITQNIMNVEYIAVNTDLQDLNKNLAQTKFQLKTKKKNGSSDNNGLGAGGVPEVAKGYAEECVEELEKLVDGANMVFVTAGLGGGTGTGAAPVIAKIAKEKGILTIGVVTKPFKWEGRRRRENFEKGIEELKGNVDTLFVIPNDKLREVAIGDTDVDSAFYKADEVLMQCITGLTNIIRNENSKINLDFKDIDTVMRGKGYGHVGIGVGEGDNKVDKAIEMAKSSPLLETTVMGAKTILMNFVGSKNVTLEELYKSMDDLNDQLGDEMDLFFGYVTDESLENKVIVTLIATDLAYDHIDEDENVNANVNSTGAAAPQMGQEYGANIRFVEPSYNDVPQPSHQPRTQVNSGAVHNRQLQQGFTNVPNEPQPSHQPRIQEDINVSKPKKSRYSIPDFLRNSKK